MRTVSTKVRIRSVFGVRPSLSCPYGRRFLASSEAPSGNAETRSSPRALQKAIKAAYYRGGTSRALIIQPRDLPRNRSQWPAIFRQLMGSPDPYGRQLDGMGAGISSLSKICLVEPCNAKVHGNLLSGEQSPSNDSQPIIDYTFVGLGVQDDLVDVAGNCGNMSSAIGPFAYNSGLLTEDFYREKQGSVTIRMRNTNTMKLFAATFDVVDGQAAVQGNYSIDGVAGTGAKMKLDFMNPFGSKTGKLLPTGKKVDIIVGHRASCVDGANPAIFVRADDVGITGTVLPNELDSLPEKLELLEKIRRAGAVAMGLAKSEDEVARTIPKIGMVSMSSTHEVLSGETIKSASVDIVVRFISDGQPHRAIPLTAALTTAVAAKLPGTIVEQLLAPEPIVDDAITIGHASGRIQVNANMIRSGSELEPESASVYRTARRIFEGHVYWTDYANTEERPVPEDIDELPNHSLGLAYVLESRGKDSSLLFKGSTHSQVAACTSTDPCNPEAIIHLPVRDQLIELKRSRTDLLELLVELQKGQAQSSKMNREIVYQLKAARGNLNRVIDEISGSDALKRSGPLGHEEPSSSANKKDITTPHSDDQEDATLLSGYVDGLKRLTRSPSLDTGRNPPPKNSPTTSKTLTWQDKRRLWFNSIDIHRPMYHKRLLMAPLTHRPLYHKLLWHGVRGRKVLPKAAKGRPLEEVVSRQRQIGRRIPDVFESVDNQERRC
ncbi:PrpF protein-domain-containing protein [Clohesyomyces aquaticus]|uniref:PrpF protein-domain-containing protein n=1 Tax=Clohesyomyces aquaticus TaxID=1231657 RepID=A0A1Y2A9T6_9PLEO|nr:PrpF protein-domain-containing protein [Clohesyomyces aquaticus]